jgi:hypothetical protein
VPSCPLYLVSFNDGVVRVVDAASRGDSVSGHANARMAVSQQKRVFPLQLVGLTVALCPQMVASRQESVTERLRGAAVKKK